MTLSETSRPPRSTATDVDLSTYDGQVVLVVNIASQCGLTPQYADLQQLYDDFADRGFTVLGFPCDQFGNQEPGTEAEIAKFCETSYGVTFPMFAKVDVNGPTPTRCTSGSAQKQAGSDGGEIDWNFAKFLVGRDGQVIARYGPRTAARRPARGHREGLSLVRRKSRSRPRSRSCQPGATEASFLRSAHPRFGGPERGADDAGPVLQLGGHDLGLDVDQVEELAESLLTPPPTTIRSGENNFSTVR